MIRRHGLEIVLWIALLTVPLWLTHVGGYSALGSKILVYGIAALALNLVLGFTGGLSFGHAAYFGLGAYGAGMTLKYLVASTPLAIVIGTLVGGIAATLLGPLVMRRRGIYFAMITIAIGQLFYFVAVRWNNVTGGEDGLAGFRRQPLHLGNLVYDVQDEAKYYYLVLLCFAIAVVIMRALLASPLGHTWVAIRENRRRAQFLGLRTDLYVWAAFAISGTLTAMAGTLNAMLFNFTSPQDLHWILSGNFVIMCVLGGMRKFWGPMVGVAIFVVAQDYLSSLTDNWMSLIGLLFVLIVLLFPKGILGLIAPRRREVSTPRAPGIQQADAVLEEDGSPLRDSTKSLREATK
jgi:branched-chain amino acid transport system permease protein